MARRKQCKYLKVGMTAQQPHPASFAPLRSAKRLMRSVIRFTGCVVQCFFGNLPYVATMSRKLFATIGFNASARKRQPQLPPNRPGVF